MCAESKYLENFELYVKNTQCKHILFGCCHDEGYVSVLHTSENDGKLASRISLIQPFHPHKDYLNLPFDLVQFHSVFRGTELLSRKESCPSSSRASGTPSFTPINEIGDTEPSTLDGVVHGIGHKTHPIWTCAVKDVKRPKALDNGAIDNHSTEHRPNDSLALKALNNNHTYPRVCTADTVRYERTVCLDTRGKLSRMEH